MQQQFEFVIYDDGANFLRREYRPYRNENTARKAAGRISVKSGGPVDLAYAGGADWDERYITTASPCPYSRSGYRWERIA